MKNFSLFKSALIDFPTLNRAKRMPFSKVLLYLFFLIVLAAIPEAVQFSQTLQELKSDGLKIAEKLPDFKIAEGALKVADAEDAGFIYQTNSIIFTFDPEGKRTAEDIKKDAFGSTFALALLDDQLVFALPQTDVADSLLQQNNWTIAYTNEALKGLTGAEIKQTLTSAQLSPLLLVIILLVILYFVGISFVVNLLFISFGALLFAKIRFYSLRWFECFKIIVYCATWPVIICTIAQLALPTIDSSLILVFATLMLFFRAVSTEIPFKKFKK